MATAPVGPVFLPEALERLLPYCENDPHKVADWLDTRHRRNDIPLLGGSIVMPPAWNPSSFGIKAHIPPDGRAVLYVQIRRPIDDCAVWEPGQTVERLERHHQFWVFARAEFERHFPDAPISEQHDHSSSPILELNKSDYASIANAPIPDEPENRGGLPVTSEELKTRGGRDYDHAALLAEAFVYVAVKGELPKTVLGEGGLYDQLKLRLNTRCPERSQFSKIFKPLIDRIKRERSQDAESATKLSTHPRSKSSPKIS